MGNYALVRDGVIENIIVVEDLEWLDDHVAEEGYDKAVDTSKLSTPVGPGYVVKGTSYVPPVTLTSNKATISAQGNDAATVTYTDNRPSPPASVDGTVNGQALTVALTKGVGSFDVTSANSGDTVTIILPGASLVIGVT